jgi:hypothetical protein
MLHSSGPPGRRDVTRRGGTKRQRRRRKPSPAAPIQSTEAMDITMDPNAAPSANPRYMKDAFSDKPTAAWAVPTTVITRCCYAGKKTPGAQAS